MRNILDLLIDDFHYMHLWQQGMVPEYYMTQTGSEVDFVVQPDAGGNAT